MGSCGYGYYTEVSINPEYVRGLVEKLPPHVFDELVEDFPEILVNREPFVLDYINFEEGRTLSEVADDWNYDDVEDFMDNFLVMEFSDGILVVE